jgi:hypothetical protein
MTAPRKPGCIGINIEGSSVDPDTFAQLAQSIVDILTTGFETHAEQDVIAKALDVLGSVVPATGPSISGCNVTMNAEARDEQ